jgi:Mn2+/Fe2+ NRAMP family transporter
MDELFKLLVKKVNYVAIIILGFIIPGNVLIFVWNQDLYFEIDIIRLLVLSFGIAFIVYVPNFILMILLIAFKAILTEGDKERR